MLRHGLPRPRGDARGRPGPGPRRSANDEIRDRLRWREALPRLARRARRIDLADLDEPEGAALAARDAGVPLREAHGAPGLPLRRRGRGRAPHGRDGRRAPGLHGDRRAARVPLHERTASFFDYFNQLFAQVTNPPIDALRESIVTSHAALPRQPRQPPRGLRAPRAAWCASTRAACSNERGSSGASARSTAMGLQGRTARARPTRAPRRPAAPSSARARRARCRACERDVRGGANIVVISDRAARGRGARPVAAARSAACTTTCIRCGPAHPGPTSWWRCGDAFSAHDFAAPRGLSRRRASTPTWPTTRIRDAVRHAASSHSRPRTALSPATTAPSLAGIVSIMSKMGISTMQGYHCRPGLRGRWACLTSSSIGTSRARSARVGGLTHGRPATGAATSATS